ncbi:MAG: hypothetical protein JZU64_03475 [Rhodoferax sp.]|jgi:hypothetical protein|nr:hypothetical protein [Rhodoferax sp.]
MSTAPKNLPRFIPTLTEVVDPASLTSLTVISRPDVEAMVTLVQQQIQPIFERRLQEELDRLVRAGVARQWADISTRLQDEMDMFVRQAVIDAIGTLAKAKTPK